MIFNVDENIVEKLLENCKFLDLNETSFLQARETVYEAKSVTIAREVSKYKISVDAEKKLDEKEFIKLCKNFFDPKLTKVFYDKKTYLFIGKDFASIKGSELGNGEILDELFKDYKSKTLNYSVISFEADNLLVAYIAEENRYFLEIQDEALESSIVSDLQLTRTGAFEHWADVCEEYGFSNIGETHIQL